MSEDRNRRWDVCLQPWSSSTLSLSNRSRLSLSFFPFSILRQQCTSTWRRTSPDLSSFLFSPWQLSHEQTRFLVEKPSLYHHRSTTMIEPAVSSVFPRIRSLSLYVYSLILLLGENRCVFLLDRWRAKNSIEISRLSFVIQVNDLVKSVQNIYSSSSSSQANHRKEMKSRW